MRDFYEKFLREHADQPARSYDLALALYHLADIHRQLGELPAADAYKKAQDLLTGLCESPTSPTEYRATLADVGERPGPHPERSRAVCGVGGISSEVKDILDRVTREQPANDDYRMDVALNRQAAPLVYSHLGRWEESEAANLAGDRAL